MYFTALKGFSNTFIPTTGFEPWTCGVRIDHSANRSTPVSLKLVPLMFSIWQMFYSFKHPNKPHMGDPNTRGFSLPEVVVDDVIFAAGRSPHKAHPKLHPTYTMMPEKWAEVTDTKSGWVLVLFSPVFYSTKICWCVSMLSKGKAFNPCQKLMVNKYGGSDIGSTNVNKYKQWIK